MSDRRFFRQGHLLVAIWLVCALVPLAGVPAAGASAAEEHASYVAGEVLIGWRPGSIALPAVRRIDGLELDRASSEWQQALRVLSELTGLEVLEAQPDDGFARLAVPPGRERAEIARLQALPGVAYAELNHIARAASSFAGGFYPNDPFIGDQWNMRRIAAPQAWAVTMGSYSIVVAALDSGVDRTHPEFAVRLLPGYDFVNRDSDPSDDYGHGTHVTGILAAAANNATGVAGLAPNVKILPFKVLDNTGGGSYYNIAEAIRRAANSGAQVINLSLGGFDADATLSDAVHYAIFEKGALVVAAAGNCGQGGPYCKGVNPEYYPAAYPGVLAVAASDHFDNWAKYSGFKPYVALAAPGGIVSDQVWSTVPGGYGFLYGTSMATPLVSAAAALVLTMQPAATWQQIGEILKNTADRVGTHPDTGQAIPYVSGRNNYFGSGRLNVSQAVRWAYPPSLVPVTEVQRFLLGGPRMEQTRSVVLANLSDQAVWWQATVLQTANWLNASPSSGVANYARAGSLGLRAGPTALAAGIYTATVRIQALYPAGLPDLDIAAELEVSPAVRRSFLPIVTNNRPEAIWSDPFDPSSLGGRALYLTDNTLRQVVLPFPVTFYRRTYSELWVSDNGLVVFGQPPAAAAQPPAACPPTAAAPNNALYVLALDWVPELGGQVYVHQPDVDAYAISWYDVRRAGAPLPHSFQLILRRDGLLTASYRSIEWPAPGMVGAENDDGTVAQVIRCSAAGRMIAAGDAVTLDATLPW